MSKRKKYGKRRPDSEIVTFRMRADHLDKTGKERVIRAAKLFAVKYCYKRNLITKEECEAEMQIINSSFDKKAA